MRAKATESKEVKKYYSVSFLKTSFGVALLLGTLFLTLGAMRIYVATLEKKLSHVDHALTSLQNDYAQSVYAFAVATNPHSVLESGRKAQKMSMSFKKTALLHVPFFERGIPSSQEKSSPAMENPAPLKLAEKAFLEFFVPLASAQGE